MEGFRKVCDLAITRRYQIPAVLLGRSGVFIFIETRDTRSENVTMAQFAIRRSLLLSYDNVYSFVRTPAGDYIFSNKYISREEITKKKIEEIIRGCQDTDVISNVTLDNLEDHCRKFQKYTRSKLIMKDGIVYEQHCAGFPLGLSFRDEYFPVAEDDPKKFLMIAVFGGLFGAHKFVTGQWSAGLFYLLTCGGFGVFHLFDIIAILTGSYYIRQISYEDDGRTCKRRAGRVYLRRLGKEQVKYGIAGLIASSFVSYLAYVKLFIPALIMVGEVFIQ